MSFDAIAAPRHRDPGRGGRRGDLGAIEEIAYSAFTTGRFLLDWRLRPS